MWYCIIFVVNFITSLLCNYRPCHQCTRTRQRGSIWNQLHQFFFLLQLMWWYQFWLVTKIGGSTAIQKEWVKWTVGYWRPMATNIVLVPNYQNISKYIFDGKKWNVPITSTFGPIKTWLLIHRTSKLCKLLRSVSSHSFLIIFTHLLAFKNPMTKFLNVKRWAKLLS